MQEKEIWRDIKGYEGKYQVSNMGRVRNVQTGKILKPRPQKGGYLKIMLYKDDKRREHVIHRLVAEHFLQQPEGKTQVTHKDGNKHNNHVSNLAWVSPSEVALQCYLNGDHGHAVLTAEDVREIRQKYAQGGTSYMKLADEYYVSHHTIWKVLTRRTWQNVT